MRTLAAVVLVLLAACGRQPPAGVTELVYATPYSPNHPFSRADQAWMRFVEERSGGKLRIRPSWSGALLSANESMTELRHGVADIGLITPIYAKGGAHLIRIQSGFYSGVETVEMQVALFRCLASHSPQIGRELKGLKVLAVQGGALPGLVTRTQPVQRLADLRGMRLRAPTELLRVLREFGADPVNMPMGEVYSALAKGVIDGVIAPPDTFRALHFAEVAGHYTSIQVPRGAYPARAMGERRWQRLTAAEQAVLEAAIPVWETALAEQIQLSLQEGMRAAEAANVQFHGIDPVEQANFEERYRQEAQRNAEALSRFGIDGVSVLDLARSSVREDGGVHCPGVD